MALEEVGTRLVAQGEAQFVAAMNSADKAVENFGKTTISTGKQTQTAAKSTDVFKSSFQQLTGISLTGAGAILAAGVAIQKLVEFAGNAIEAASNMNETISKSTVVFGDANDAILEMGNTAAKSMGMSKQAAIEAAGTYGNLFTSMGLTQEKSAEMSAALVQLAADQASFNNLPTADVLEKIRSGLTGETEPLKSLGININEAMLKQEALNLGLKVGTGTLDAATKAQAAYSLMLKQSANATGDFARTADGAANQQKILDASNQDLIASIGKGLLPAWISLLKVGNSVLDWLNNLINAQDKLISTAKKTSDANLKTAKTYAEYEESVNAVVKADGMYIKNGKLMQKVDDGMGASHYNVIDSFDGITESTFNAIKMEEDWGTEADRGAGLSSKLNLAAREAAGGTDELATAQAKAKIESEKLNNTMSGLRTMMAGAVGNENAAYKKSMDDLNLELDDTNRKLDALNKIKGPWTEEQRASYATLMTKQKELKAGITEIEIEHDRASKAMIFDLLEQQLAYDGLSQKEGEVLIGMAEKWGLVDPATKEAYLAVSQFAGDSETSIDNTTETVQELIDRIARITGKDVTITTHYRDVYEGGGSPRGGKILPRAAGGPVQARHPYIVGERGPEPFIPSMSGYVLSREEAKSIFAKQVAAVMPVSSVSAGPANYNYAYSTAYNLQVMTNQSPQVIQRSFAMMKLLAG